MGPRRRGSHGQLLCSWHRVSRSNFCNYLSWTLGQFLRGVICLLSASLEVTGSLYWVLSRPNPNGVVLRHRPSLIATRYRTYIGFAGRICIRMDKRRSSTAADKLRGTKRPRHVRCWGHGQSPKLFFFARGYSSRRINWTQGPLSYGAGAVIKTLTFAKYVSLPNLVALTPTIRSCHGSKIWSK